MKQAERKDLMPSPYGDKVDRIFRVLLSRRINKLTWYRIAKDADVGYGWAYHVLKGLERDRLIDGPEIKNAKAVFARWAARQDRRVYREYHIQDSVKVLKGTKMLHAFTGYFAENLVGHYLFPRYYEFYIRREEAPRWNDFLSRNGYVGKGNVQIILADEHVFYESQVVDGWPVVSIQQLIVDLFRAGAECTEAADILVGKAYR